MEKAALAPFNLPDGTLALAYRALSGNSRTIERLQATFHSCLLICVAASHSVMQSCTVVPPPCAAIDAASL